MIKRRLRRLFFRFFYRRAHDSRLITSDDEIQARIKQVGLMGYPKRTLHDCHYCETPLFDWDEDCPRCGKKRLPEFKRAIEMDAQ